MNKRAELGENLTLSSLSDQHSDNSDASFESNCSNWTKGKNKQRLRVPNSLKNNNQISKAVIERKIKLRLSRV